MVSKSEASPNNQVQQHYRVTLETARRHYKAGHLTATGLVYFAIAIQRQPGWKLRMDAQMVEKELGIKKTAFYNAISRLKADGWIEWEAPEGINAWIPTGSEIQALLTLPDSQQGDFSANAESRPQTRKDNRDRGKDSALLKNRVLEPAPRGDCQTLTDIQQTSNTQQTNSPVVVEEKKAEEKPEVSREELDAALTRLRVVGVKLNQTVRSTVKSHYTNFEGAIANIKERLTAGEQFRNLEGAFVKACKDGAKPEKSNALVNLPQPSTDQLTQLEEAKQREEIKDYYPAPCGGGKTIVVDDFKAVAPWWVFLKVNKDKSCA